MAMGFAGFADFRDLDFGFERGAALR